MQIELTVIEIEKPQELNVIIGQSHFIKTVEDVYEVLISSVPSIKFGLAFSEASGKRLVRVEGNDDELKKIASQNIFNLGCGHTFFIALENAYPVNILNQVKNVPEVCRIFCATANPIQAIVAKTHQGNSLLGVVDGFSPLGIESNEDKKEREDLLRKIGYKL